MKKTLRMVLRKVAANDLDYIYQLNQDPEVLRYINNGIVQSKEESQEDLMNILKLQTVEYGYWLAKLEDDNQFLGWFALKELENTASIELGFRLLKEHWNKGYATEGARFLADYALFQLNLPEIVAVVDPNNQASVKVLEKIGMKYGFEGKFYGYDLSYYNLTKELFNAQGI